MKYLITLKNTLKNVFINNTEEHLTDALLHVTNPKHYRKLLRRFINNNKNSEIIPPLKSTNENGEGSYDSTVFDSANAFNKYFVSISKL